MYPMYPALFDPWDLKQLKTWKKVRVKTLSSKFSLDTLDTWKHRGGGCIQGARDLEPKGGYMDASRKKNTGPFFLYWHPQPAVM